MQFHRVLVFFLLGYYTANMNTPPVARKRGFKLELLGDDSERDSLRSKFQQIKQSSNDRLTNTDVLNKVLDIWICSNLEQSHAGAPAGNVQPPPAYHKCDKEDTNASIFLCTHSSVENLVQAAEFHSRHCSKILHQSENKHVQWSYCVETKMSRRSYIFLDKFSLPTKWTFYCEYQICAFILIYRDFTKSV